MYICNKPDLAGFLCFLLIQANDTLTASTIHVVIPKDDKIITNNSLDKMLTLLQVVLLPVVGVNKWWVNGQVAKINDRNSWIKKVWSISSLW